MELMVRIIKEMQASHVELLCLLKLTNQRIDDLNARLNEELQSRDENEMSDHERRFTL